MNLTDSLSEEEDLGINLHCLFLGAMILPSLIYIVFEGFSSVNDLFDLHT